MSNIARQLALETLIDIEQNKAYTDIALQRVLGKDNISMVDRHFISELVYGVVRRKRTLNSLINQLATKKATQQPLKLRSILQMGLYQLRYLDKIPPSAAVNTSVELAKNNGFKKLAGVVNGVLRSYLRKSESQDCLVLPDNPISRLGVKYSFPDWIVSSFLQQYSSAETEKLLQWFNQSPTIDLRVNPLKITLEELQEKLFHQGIESKIIEFLPQGLTIIKSAGNLAKLREFQQGLFTIQDSSAQLVSHLLNPQPHETIIDACASPGGKTSHIAELMKDTGKIIALDYHLSRLDKIRENVQRLGLTSVEIAQADSSLLHEYKEKGDRVLVDVPCSGLGTLHKNPDIRWQKKSEQISNLTELQSRILTNTSQWVKPGGILLYSTCTLNTAENEDIINKFLKENSQWHLETKSNTLSEKFSITSKGMIKIFPPNQQMDGFFMATLIKGV